MASGERLLAVGVDGAPRGWLAVGSFSTGPEAARAARRTEPRFFDTVEGVIGWRDAQSGGDTAPVAVDMPIGLPTTVEFRACDREARQRLGKRRSSVFHPPARYLLEAAEPVDGKAPDAQTVFLRVQQLVEARKREVADQVAGAGAAGTPPVLGLSRQGAGILLKVSEVDAWLLGDPTRQELLFEVHPELCFAAMNGGQVLPPKASAHGQLKRLDLVRQSFPDAEANIRSWPDGERHSLLDVVDAYAACWTALRFVETGGGAVGQRTAVTPPLEVLGETTPGNPQREIASGLRMEMVT